MREILLDLETSPNLAYCWEMWETNVLSFVKERELLCFSYKITGEKKVHTYSLQNLTPLKLTKKLHEVINSSDIIVAHNGDEFDLKMANAFFAHLGLKPPKPYKTIDTLKIARSKFRFNSNKLNDLGEYLGLGQKVETGGFKLWLGCLKNNRKAWRKMKQYNAQDVILLEKVYKVLKPWAKTPNFEPGLKCPSCGSDKMQRRGWNLNLVFKTRRFQCQDCGHWCTSNQKIKYNKSEYLI